MAAISKHCGAWLSDRTLRRGTPVEWARHNTFRHQARNYARAAAAEADTLSRVHHVIGRTTFDRAIANQLNPNINYYHCNESLRDSSYQSEWAFESCDRHSVLLSQASRQYKGAHQLLEALKIVLSRYPDARLRVAGPDQSAGRGFRAIAKSAYSRYLVKLIREFHLKDKVTFIGPQDQAGCVAPILVRMCLSHAHQPRMNQIHLAKPNCLGMPVVASFVGGVPDRITHGESGFAYQGDASYMLAHYICEVFANDDKATKMGANASNGALVVNDRDSNHSKLVEIYTSILEAQAFPVFKCEKAMSAPSERG